MTAVTASGAGNGSGGGQSFVVFDHLSEPCGSARRRSIRQTRRRMSGFTAAETRPYCADPSQGLWRPRRRVLPHGSTDWWSGVSQAAAYACVTVETRCAGRSQKQGRAYLVSINATSAPRRKSKPRRWTAKSKDAPTSLASTQPQPLDESRSRDGEPIRHSEW